MKEERRKKSKGKGKLTGPKLRNCKLSVTKKKKKII